MGKWTMGTQGQPDEYIARRGFAPVDDSPYVATVDYDVELGAHRFAAYSQRDASGAVRCIAGTADTAAKAKREAARALRSM